MQSVWGGYWQRRQESPNEIFFFDIIGRPTSARLRRLAHSAGSLEAWFSHVSGRGSRSEPRRRINNEVLP
jgi:hypothetical protein